MTGFGEQLRKFRHRSNNSKSPQGKLTQEELGELIGAELGIGYTGAAVSDWERGKTKIQADDRPVLIGIIKVLHVHEGIRTIEEANGLLKAGNYRDLDADEVKKIFGAAVDENSSQEIFAERRTSQPPLPSLLEDLFSISEKELHKVEEGPSPSWPRRIVFLVRRFSDRLSIFQILKLVLWIWVWLFAWGLTIPSLRWPFADAHVATSSVVRYVMGSILIPAFIGVLADTNRNEFWQLQQGVKKLILQLYTQQGASIGFHLGYFFLFIVGLLLHTLGWQAPGWMELIPAALLVVLGYIGARLVPYNLFAAFKRLALKDGWIFFIFILVGPAWGYFFLETYEILLTRPLGIFIVLSSLTILLSMTALRYRQSGTTLVPVRWWVTFWVSILLGVLLLLWLVQAIQASNKF